MRLRYVCRNKIKCIPARVSGACCSFCCLLNSIIWGGFGIEWNIVGIACGISDLWAGSMYWLSSKWSEQTVYELYSCFAVFAPRSPRLVFITHFLDLFKIMMSRGGSGLTLRIRGNLQQSPNKFTSRTYCRNFMCFPAYI